MFDPGEIYHGQICNIRPNMTLKCDFSYMTFHDFRAHREERMSCSRSSVQANQVGYESDDGGFTVRCLRKIFKNGGCELGR